MATTAFVRARIDEELKDEAAQVLAEMGLTVSDVVRMTLTRVARDKALPIGISSIPNVETKAAMLEAREMMKARAMRFHAAEELLSAVEQEAS
jgi:DNA-damage-inducible protein J